MKGIRTRVNGQRLKGKGEMAAVRQATHGIKQHIIRKTSEGENAGS